MYSHLIFMCLIFLTSIVFAENVSQLQKKDFRLICEISKMAQSLKSQPLFSDKAERAVVLAKALDAVIQTEEVKNVLKAVSKSSPDQKEGMLLKASAEAGFNNSKCPTLKYLVE